MQLCTLKYLQKLPVWSVLLVWFFMGGLALAEQIDLVSETSPHDEQALDALQLALKPGQIEAADDHVGIGPLDPIAEVARVPFVLSRLRVDEGRSLLNSKNTISLFMILSCYRI
ncbi:MAG: hypothetical protein ABIU05_10395 [Nitrospirales bacterium]